MNKKSGTKEWSDISKNLFIGCKHDCSYCYAKLEPPSRVRNLPWNAMKPTKEISRTPKLEKGTIMFPTLHDIFPEHIEVTVNYLSGLLKKGNNVLIVSKPHLDCIKVLCSSLMFYQSQLQFRFPIGSSNQAMLDLFEPKAFKDLIFQKNSE